MCIRDRINDVLDMSKIDAGHLEINEETFDLSALLINLKNTFDLKLENKPVNFKLDLDHEIDTQLIGDVRLLNQVFFNLVGNAEKFTDEGMIILKAKVLEKNNDFLKVYFEVKDNGIGISKENLKHIFKKFKQVGEDQKYKHGGTGLGLPICKQILALMGGELEVESIEGLGSVFHFDLEFKNTGKSLTASETITNKTSTFKVAEGEILIVEDNPMNRKYIRHILEKWRFNFDFAEDGKQAIEKCQKKKYEVIFMDLQMPIMGGFEATKIIRTQEGPNQDCPIVALTANSLVHVKNESEEIGMNGFLSKPFSPDQLHMELAKYFSLEAQKDEDLNEHEGGFRFNSEFNENYLADNYGEDLDYALDMFETFLQSFNADYVQITQGIKNKDSEACAKYAHKIKPMFTMVGLEKMTEHFETLESLAKSENMEGFISYHQQIEQHISSVLALIKTETQRMNKYLGKA